MAQFLRYLREGVGSSQFVGKLDQAVQKARDHVEWRTEYMSLQLKFYDIWDEARDEGREQGLLEGREQGIVEGREQGIEQGRLHQLFELVKDQDISLGKALAKTGMTQEEFLNGMNDYFAKS